MVFFERCSRLSRRASADTGGSGWSSQQSGGGRHHHADGTDEDASPVVPSPVKRQHETRNERSISRTHADGRDGRDPRAVTRWVPGAAEPQKLPVARHVAPGARCRGLGSVRLRYRKTVIVSPETDRWKYLQSNYYTRLKKKKNLRIFVFCRRFCHLATVEPR